MERFYHHEILWFECDKLQLKRTLTLNIDILSQYSAKDPSFPVDQIMRIIEKMQKHSKVEEAAIKLVRDLEMQIKALHTSYLVSGIQSKSNLNG